MQVHVRKSRTWMCTHTTQGIPASTVQVTVRDWLPPHISQLHTHMAFRYDNDITHVHHFVNRHCSRPVTAHLPSLVVGQINLLVGLVLQRYIG